MYEAAGSDKNLQILPIRRFAGIVLLFKEVGNARMEESDLDHISPKTPTPQYKLI